MIPNIYKTSNADRCTWSFSTTAIGAPCKLTGRVEREFPRPGVRRRRWTATVDQFPDVSVTDDNQERAIHRAAREATGVDHS